MPCFPTLLGILSSGGSYEDYVKYGEAFVAVIVPPGGHDRARRFLLLQQLDVPTYANPFWPLNPLQLTCDPPQGVQRG